MTKHSSIRSMLAVATLTTAATLVTMASPQTASTQTGTPARPNILLIQADDLGYGETSIMIIGVSVAGSARVAARSRSPSHRPTSHSQRIVEMSTRWAGYSAPVSTASCLTFRPNSSASE